MLRLPVRQRAYRPRGGYSPRQDPMALTEITLRLPNRPGQLVKVAGVLAEGRINLAAVSADSTPSRGTVRLVVSDPEQAVRRLEKAGYAVETRELLAVHLEDRAGSFLKVLHLLAAQKENVTSDAILIVREGARSLVALGVSDLDRARRHLREAGFLAAGAERLVSNADLLASHPTIPSESVGLLL